MLAIRSRQRTAAAFLVVLALTQSARSPASDYQDSEEIAPESAEEASVGLKRGDDEREYGPSRGVLDGLWVDAHPFWRDAEASLRVRAFDFRRDDGTATIADAVAAGFELAVDSGKWRDALSLSASWHTSYAIDAPEELGRTGVLAPDQSDLSVLSRAFVQWDFSQETRLRLYRQDLNMPYMNRQDSRMIPNSYEALTFHHTGKKIQVVLGQVDKMKKRDSERFVSMGEIAGVPGDDSGTTVAGIKYDFPRGVTIGAIAQHTPDMFATTYSETSYNHTFTEYWGMQLAAQLSNQWSTGEEELGEFSSYAMGLRAKISYRGAILTLAGSEIGSTAIRKPFGGTPGYTSSMISDFDRAEEKAVRIGLSQNFSKYGVESFSISVNYTRGRDAVGIDGSSLPDIEEFAVTADYRPKSGIFKGLWLRFRYGDSDRGSDLLDRRDFRVILNYNLSALQ